MCTTFFPHWCMCILISFFLNWWWVKLYFQKIVSSFYFIFGILLICWCLFKQYFQNSTNSINFWTELSLYIYIKSLILIHVLQFPHTYVHVHLEQPIKLTCLSCNIQNCVQWLLYVWEQYYRHQQNDVIVYIIVQVMIKSIIV